MIPKKIHYCWFGRGPLPELARKCIASWRKYLPEYEIKEWNEDNFDVHCIPYCSEAYDAGKYAFVSDYARFKILYEYGGLYFDTDVEVIKAMDDIISRGPFMGCERDADTVKGDGAAVAPGLGLGVNPGLGLYKEILELYETLHFIGADGTMNLKTVVQYTTEVLCKHGLKHVGDVQFVDGIFVYPKEYFNPMEFVNQVCITPNTCSIHHYAGTWLPWNKRMKKRVQKILGKRITSWCVRLKSFFR